MAKKADVTTLWTREAILQVENRLLQNIASARTPEATEAAISFARFLRLSGLDTDNYVLFLKMLEIENHWVLDELIGPGDPFLLLSTIPPNNQLAKAAFQLLTRWRPGGIYPKTLAIVLGGSAERLQFAQGRLQDLPVDRRGRGQPGQAPRKAQGTERST